MISILDISNESSYETFNKKTQSNLELEIPDFESFITGNDSVLEMLVLKLMVIYFILLLFGCVFDWEDY